MNPPGKMRQNPPYICLPKLKPPLKMKGNPGHIEDIYAIIYIRYMAYIYYGVDKDVSGNSLFLDMRIIFQAKK